MFNAPLSKTRARSLIDNLHLSPFASVLDLGCGDGLLLHQIASTYPISGVGVDYNADLIQVARSRPIPTDSTLTYVCADGKAYSQGLAPVDTIICIGAESIFGTLRDCAKPPIPYSHPRVNYLSVQSTGSNHRQKTISR